MGMTIQACVATFRPDGLREFRPAAPENYVDMNYRNAFDVLRALGVEVDDSSCFEMEIQPFLALCRQWLQRNIGKRSAELPWTEESGGNGRCTMINAGREEGYLNRRIHELTVMLSAGALLGATHVSGA